MLYYCTKKGKKKKPTKKINKLVPANSRPYARSYNQLSYGTRTVSSNDLAGFVHARGKIEDNQIQEKG